jgi:type II secretory pathway pseudopilin PulG
MKAFGILEIVFAILIVAVISSVALIKLSDTNRLSIKTKIKSDVALIRYSISNARQKLVLSGNDTSINLLDEATTNSKNQKLFNFVLDYPILSSDMTDVKGGDWVKYSSNVYKAFISKNESIDFVYDFSNGLFDCDYNITLCKELTQ